MISKLMMSKLAHSRLLCFSVLLFILLPVQAFRWYPEDEVWTSPSLNSAGSMPVGGGSIGLNLWVENGDIWIYMAKDGAFDENNTLLKQGRLRIHLSEPFDLASFRQRLVVRDGYAEVLDRDKRIRLWVDVFRPVIHLDIYSRHKINATYDYQSWRYRDRTIARKESFQCSYKFRVPKGCLTHRDTVFSTPSSLLFFHRNADSTVFEATEAQQKIRGLSYNPLSRLISGGMMEADSIRFLGNYDGSYAGTDYRAWRFATTTALREHHLTVTLFNRQGTPEEWIQGLDAIRQQIRPKHDFRQSCRWWRSYWRRSYIVGTGKAREVARNYTLFRYMMGCNAKGEWPTKFNGGLFTFDPVYVDSTYTFTPDFRRWGGGTFTAQNQRLLYWPLLKSGDYDLLIPQLEFYRRILPTAEKRASTYFHKKGAYFTEQIENFGLPEHDEYGLHRPDSLNAGIQDNAWLAYTWDTVLEFCEMALEAHQYGGLDITKYIPWIRQTLLFFQDYYTQGDSIVLYPGSACETYKLTRNASNTIAGLRRVAMSLKDYCLSTKASLSTIDSISSFILRLPRIPLRTINGYTMIAPAEQWKEIKNTELPQLYPVFPWRLFDMTIARNTYFHDPHVIAHQGYTGWEQTNIFAACLRLPEEAARWTSLKLKSGPYRFPAFWGPGHDWSPDFNHGGSGMIGLQEMLLQEENGKIIRFPACPKDWHIRFKLHSGNGKIVKGKQ